MPLSVMRLFTASDSTACASFLTHGLSDTVIGAPIALASVIVTLFWTSKRESRQFSRDKWWQLYEDRRERLE